MLRVEFIEPYRGVKEVICHHVDTFSINGRTMIQLHFTKDIFWGVKPELIKHISQSEQKKL